MGEWLANSVAGFQRWQRLLADLEGQTAPDLAMLSVALRSLGSLSGAPAAAA